MLRFLAPLKPEMLAPEWRGIGMARGGWALGKTGGLQAGKFERQEAGGWDLGHKNEERIGTVKMAEIQEPQHV